MPAALQATAGIQSHRSDGVHQQLSDVLHISSLLSYIYEQSNFKVKVPLLLVEAELTELTPFVHLSVYVLQKNNECNVNTTKVNTKEWIFTLQEFMLRSNT